jgi:hypothetical protein
MYVLLQNNATVWQGGPAASLTWVMVVGRPAGMSRTAMSTTSGSYREIEVQAPAGCSEEVEFRRRRQTSMRTTVKQPTSIR